MVRLSSVSKSNHCRRYRPTAAEEAVAVGVATLVMKVQQAMIETICASLMKRIDVDNLGSAA